MLRLPASFGIQLNGAKSHKGYLGITGLTERPPSLINTSYKLSLPTQQAQAIDLIGSFANDAPKVAATMTDVIKGKWQIIHLM